MKLNDIYDMTIKDVIKQMDINDLRINSNKYGNISSIEVKYIPKQQLDKPFTTEEITEILNKERISFPETSVNV